MTVVGIVGLYNNFKSTFFIKKVYSKGHFFNTRSTKFILKKLGLIRRT